MLTKKNTLLAMFIVTLFTTLISACPHPDLREAFPEAYVGFEERLQQQMIWDELDADSSHSYDAIALRGFFFPVLQNNNFLATVELDIVYLDIEETTFPVHLAGCNVSDLFINDQEAEYVHEDGVILIDLPENTENGDTLRLEISYDGIIRENPYFGGMVYSEDRDVLYTFGEPYETRYWLACYDLPFDKLDTVEITVDTPEQYRVASNGSLIQNEDIGGGVRRTTWRNTDPISTYLISIAAHPYTVIEDGTYGVNDAEVNFYAYPQFAEVAAFEFGRTGEMIEMFEEQFGPYPFHRYDQAMAAIFNGWGAMEHQTCTTYGDNLVVAGGRRYEAIVAHELGHQWFGDHVSPLTFANIWLNEGFASYSEILWAENFGEEAMRESVGFAKQAYFNEDEGTRYPMYDPPADYLFGRVVYDKGACVVHMLRWLVGDDLFFASLTEYMERFGGGNAVTSDLQQTFEDVTEKDLDFFFDEWVYDQGHPEYFIHSYMTQEDGNGGYRATLELEQMQSNAPYFSMPLPLDFYNDTQDTIIRVEVEGVRSQTIVVEGLTFEPDTYELDREQWILCEIYVQPNEPDIFLESSRYDIGYVPVGETLTWNLPVRNRGRLPLEITSMGTQQPAFDIIADFPIEIASNHTEEIEIQFTPDDYGFALTQLVIQSNDPDEPIAVTSLQGMGKIRFEPVFPYGRSYNIAVSMATVDGELLQTGDEIAVFDGELCVGAIYIEEDFPVLMRAYEGDPGNADHPGYEVGNEMSFRIWSAELGRGFTAEPEYIRGDGTFEGTPNCEIHLNALTDVEEIGNALPVEFQVGKVYPNPFNPTLNVPVTLPKNRHLTVKLVNLLGQVVVEQSRVLSQGNHTIQLNPPGDASSGVYLLQIEFEKELHIQKAVYMR
ncbi:T9SS type A sorting domain-containing protein [bacterium]|nr:T9SS type A sorting domain-containing protein [bacterium]